MSGGSDSTHRLTGLPVSSSPAFLTASCASHLPYREKRRFTWVEGGGSARVGEDERSQAGTVREDRRRGRCRRGRSETDRSSLASDPADREAEVLPLLRLFAPSFFHTKRTGRGLSPRDYTNTPATSTQFRHPPPRVSDRSSQTGLPSTSSCRFPNSTGNLKRTSPRSSCPSSSPRLSEPY